MSEDRAPRATVAVLAGGLGTRMGAAKAAVELGGRALIDYPLRAASRAGLDAIVIAKRSSELPALSVRVVYERDEPRHPLSGVIAALREVDERARRSRAGGERGQLAVLAVACDMPFLTGRLLAWLASIPADAVVTELGGALQPFPALYRFCHIATLERSLAREQALRATLELLRPRVVGEGDLHAFGEPSRLCFSVNDREDLETARGWIDER